MRGGNWCYLDYGESAACVCLGCVEGEGCVDQVGVYDEPGASLAMGCYLGTPGNGYLWWVNGI